MNVDYRGYRITCERQPSSDNSFVGNYLSVRRYLIEGERTPHLETSFDPHAKRRVHFLTSTWFEGRVKNGVDYGKKIVDRHLGPAEDMVGWKIRLKVDVSRSCGRRYEAGTELYVTEIYKDVFVLSKTAWGGFELTVAEQWKLEKVSKVA